MGKPKNGKPQIVKDFTKQIYDKLDVAREKKRLSWAELIRLLDPNLEIFNKNTPNDWKNGKSDGFCNYLDQLCEILDLQKSEVVYFNISGNNTNNHIVNSFNKNSTLTITENNLSKQERELVEIYRNLSLLGQMDLITYALKLKNGGQ